MFARTEMEEAELIEDIECLAGLTIDPAHPPWSENRSFIYTYHFPEQETTMKSGDNAICVSTLNRISDVQIDQDDKSVTFKCSARYHPLDDKMSIGPGGPISTQKITNALFKFADSVIAQDDKYQAIHALLAQDLPRILPVAQYITP